jgi:hypothetical protein
VARMQAWLDTLPRGTRLQLFLLLDQLCAGLDVSRHLEHLRGTVGLEGTRVSARRKTAGIRPVPGMRNGPTGGLVCTVAVPKLRLGGRCLSADLG